MYKIIPLVITITIGLFFRPSNYKIAYKYTWFATADKVAFWIYIFIITGFSGIRVIIGSLSL